MLLLKKIILNIMIFGIFCLAIIILLLYLVGLYSPATHKFLIDILPLPQFIVNLDNKIQNPEINASINTSIVQSNLSFYNTPTYFRNCKIIGSFESQLDTFNVLCGNDSKIKTIKFLNLYFPKKGECGFIQSQKFLKDNLKYKSFKVSSYASSNNIEYSLILLNESLTDDKNFNNDILKNGWAFYYEHGLSNASMITSFKDSNIGLEGLYKTCTVQNKMSVSGEQKLEYN